MSQLPALFEEEGLQDRLEEALDVDETIESPDGTEMELPPSVQRSIQEQNVADTIAEFLSERAVEIDEIEQTELMFGSGDTGRQTQLYLEGEDGVSKEVLRIIAKQVDVVLDAVFPVDYLVGVTHGYTIEDDEYKETDTVSVYLVYKARTQGRPTKPSGDSTEIIEA